MTDSNSPLDTPDAVVSASTYYYGSPCGLNGPGKVRSWWRKLIRKREVLAHYLITVTYRDYSQRTEQVNFGAETSVVDFANKLMAAPTVRQVWVSELLVKARKSFGADYDPKNWLAILEASNTKVPNE